MVEEVARVLNIDDVMVGVVISAFCIGLGFLLAEITRRK